MNPIYTIRLDGIYVRAFHGCYDLEQQVGNRFRVDIVREGKFIYYELNTSVLEEVLLWMKALKGE